MCDTIIIGTGPAGLSAAIFCGRANLKTVVFGKKQKTQLWLAKNIENYFGFEKIDGPELLDKGIKQAKKFNVEFIEKEIVDAKKLNNKDKKFVVKSDDAKEYETKSIVIATGVPIKVSGIKNEQKFISKGVHYCVSCDGPFYQGKKVAVIGNGNRAAEEALDLLHYTNDITIISHSDKFEFSKIYEDKLKEKNIKLVNKKIFEFIGYNMLKKLKFEDGEELVVDGIFMACGAASSLDFANELGLEIKDNVMVIDNNGMTNVEGVFAAGNCSGKCRQIAKNVGDGCNAALSVIKFVSNKEIYLDYARH